MWILLVASQRKPLSIILSVMILFLLFSPLLPSLIGGFESLLQNAWTNDWNKFQELFSLFCILNTIFFLDMPHPQHDNVKQLFSKKPKLLNFGIFSIPLLSF
jgi:hypothetical protein